MLELFAERQVSGQFHASSSLPPAYKRYKFNYMLEGRRREVPTELWWGNLKEKHHLEDPEVDGRIILIGSSRSGMGGMDWIYRIQNKGSWRAFVNVVMNLQVP